MRKLALGLALAGFMGSAAAGDDAWSEARYADGNDYSAKLFYSLDFGQQGHAQSVGLRFDNVIAESRGAPALFKASFDGASKLPTVSFQGVDVAGPALASNAAEGGGGFAGLGVGQIIGIVFTGAVFVGILSEAANNDDPAPSGSGGS